AVRLDPRRYLAHKALARLHARCAADGDRAATCLRQVVGEAKEGEAARFLSRSPLPTLQQAAVAVQHCRLLRHDPQPEGCESLVHLLPKSLGVFAVLERGYVVVSEPREFCVTSAGLSEASFEPQVEDIVQVDIRKHWADGAALRHPLAQVGHDAV